MSDDPANGTPGSAGRDDDLINQARRQMEDVESDPGGLAHAMPPPDSFPGYDLVREIHRGGQGAVYLAVQRAAKRKVAIKVMHGGPHVGSSGRARFEREVQVLGQLNHPNIVRIHDSGVTADGSFFYVMDYISGRTLDEYVAASKPRLEDALRLFSKICDAVNAAHLRGVIHRDIKPGNIRVTQAGEPVIVDFGLARIAVPEMTQESRPQLMSMTGQFIGSLPWASPEQAEGNPAMIDVRTDVYSLGVVLYQMLTGRFPYEVVGQMRDVLDNILRAVPARPSTIRRQINNEVETIVLKCLSKERDRRYQSAGELARDIQHYLNGEPIEAKRDSGWYVISKTLGRYRVQASVGVLFLVLVIAFGVMMSILYRQKATLYEEKVQAEKTATAEADTANRIRAFLESVFGAVKPSEARGRDVLVIEILDAASARVENELADRPEVAVRIHEVIGQTYLSLLALEKAKTHLDRSLALRRELSGPGHRDTLAAMNSVALRLRNSAQYSEAEALYRQVLDGLRAAPAIGPRHADTASTMVNLARTLEVQRSEPKAVEALSLYAEAADVLGALPDKARALANTLMNQGNLLSTRGQHEEALGAISRACDALGALPDAANDPDLAKARLARATAMWRAGSDSGEVEAAFREAVGDIRRLLKDTHPDTLAARARLATLLREQNKLDEATAEFADIVARVTGGALPKEHPYVSHYQGDYGECLLLAGRYQEAEDLLRASHDAYVGRDPTSPGSATARERLYRLYQQWGKPDQAAPFAPK